MILAAGHGVLAAGCLPFAIARFGVWYFAAMAVCCGAQAWLLHLAPRRRAARHLARAGRVLFWLWIALLVLAQGLVLQGQRADPAAERAQVILVLGAGLREGEPSPVLQARLDVAADFLQRHPDSRAVLCGGLGPGQPNTEAAAMARYLTRERGIDPGRLLLEERSTDTRENILFARQILEEQGLADAATAAVTSDFHLCRARRLMEWAGLDGCGLPAPTPGVLYGALLRLRETGPLLWLLARGG